MPYVPDEVLEMPQGFFFRKAVNLDLSNKCTLACLACTRTTAFEGKNKLVPGVNPLSVKSVVPLPL